MYIFNSLPPLTEKILDRIHPSSQVDTTSDFVSDWISIDTWVNPQATRDQEKYWKSWQLYAATWTIEPFLQGCEQIDIIILVTAFAAWVWQD